MLAQVAQGKDWCVAALDYELGYLLEPRSAPPGWQPPGNPLARFWRFADCEVLDVAQAEAWLAHHARTRGAVDAWVEGERRISFAQAHA